MGASNCTKAPISRFSEIYNTVRRPMESRVLGASMKAGLLCELIAPGFAEVVEGNARVPLEKLVELFGIMGEDLDWVWKGDDRRTALEMLPHPRSHI